MDGWMEMDTWGKLHKHEMTCRNEDRRSRITSTAVLSILSRNLSHSTRLFSVSMSHPAFLVDCTKRSFASSMRTTTDFFSQRDILGSFSPLSWLRPPMTVQYRWFLWPFHALPLHPYILLGAIRAIMTYFYCSAIGNSDCFNIDVLRLSTKISI